MQNLDQRTIDRVVDETFGIESEDDLIKRRAIELIESRTGLKRLDEILRRPPPPTIEQIAA